MAHEQTVVALFARSGDAHQAINDLIASGIGPERVGYLEPLDERHLKNPAKGAAEGIAVGAASGAVVGGVLAAAAVALIPGLGPALVAGALLPIVTGAAGGVATGAVGGALLGTELGSDEELYFMQEVQTGRTLVSVDVEGEGQAELTSVLAKNGALEVDRLATQTLHARLRHPSDKGK